MQVRVTSRRRPRQMRDPDAANIGLPAQPFERPDTAGAACGWPRKQQYAAGDRRGKRDTVAYHEFRAQSPVQARPKRGGERSRSRRRENDSYRDHRVKIPLLFIGERRVRRNDDQYHPDQQLAAPPRIQHPLLRRQRSAAARERAANQLSRTNATASCRKEGVQMLDGIEPEIAEVGRIWIWIRPRGPIHRPRNRT